MKDVLSTHIRSLSVAAKLITAACTVGLLYYGRVVLIPLSMALLLAFALNPAVRGLMRLRLPRGLAVLFVLGGFISGVAGVSWFIGGQLASFAEELPNYRHNITEKVREGRAFFSGGWFDRIKEVISGIGPEGTETQVSQKPALTEWLSSLGAVTDPLTTAGLTVLLVAMMLLKWSDLRGRVLGLLAGNVSHTTKALADAGERVGKYLFLQLAYNSLFGLVVGTALTVMDVKYAALWGLCAAVFRYLPYIGPIFAAALPVLVSLFTTSGWSQVSSVLLLFFILELISNNFIEPWLYGSRLGVSEMGIILCTVIWTYLWGAAGLLLATPLTVCLVVLGTYVPCLSFFAKLLGTDEAFTNPQQIYQRLLAGDDVEAAELTQHQVREQGSGKFLSDTLLPALSLARRDQVARWLSAESATHLKAEVLAVCEELANGSDAGQEKNGTASFAESQQGGPLLLWSACPFTDTILPSLSRELQLYGRKIELVESSALTGAVLQQFSEPLAAPSAICAVYLNAVDQPRVNSLVKRITRVLPDVPTLVAQLGGETLSQEAKTELTLSGAVEFASNLSQVRTAFLAYAATSKAVKTNDTKALVENAS